MKPIISVCIITLGRHSIYRTLESVFSQKLDVNFEIVIVLQGELDMERINSLNFSKIPLYIYKYPTNLGFGYYRNKCASYANGQILAWIDDDEWAMDDKWLLKISKPILGGFYQVTTSGCYVPLGQGYWSDCVSLLGWPGGGALGFTKVWKVEKDSTTEHLCGANFCIKKSLLHSIGGFDTNLANAFDDNFLGDKILFNRMQIYFVSDALLYHEARSIKNIKKWFLVRINGIGEYVALQKKEKSFSRQINMKFFHLKNLIIAFSLKPHYIFGFLVILINTIILLITKVGKRLIG